MSTKRALNDTNDARLSTGLPDHFKTKKLIRRLGPGGAWYLVCLILWSRDNRPDGNLLGMTAEDIELAVDWRGDPDAFVQTLCQVGFLDGEEGGYRLHDWADHQPWAAGSEARSEKSRWAALCKTHGRAEAARQMPEYAERLSASGSENGATGSEKPASSTSGQKVANDRLGGKSASGSENPASGSDSGASGKPMAAKTGAPSPSPSPSPSPKTPLPPADEQDPPPPPPPAPTRAGEACRLMRQAGAIHVNPSHDDLLTALAFVEPEQLADVVAEAIRKRKSDPFTWALTTALNRHSRGEPITEEEANAERKSARGTRGRSAVERVRAANDRAEQRDRGRVIDHQ